MKQVFDSEVRDLILKCRDLEILKRVLRHYIPLINEYVGIEEQIRRIVSEVSGEIDGGWIELKWAKDRRYWYYYYRFRDDNGKVRSVYLGHVIPERYRELIRSKTLLTQLRSLEKRRSQLIKELSRFLG